MRPRGLSLCVAGGTEGLQGLGDKDVPGQGPPLAPGTLSSLCPGDAGHGVAAALPSCPTPVSSYSIPSHPALSSCPIPSHFIPSCPIPSCPVPLQPILPCSVPSCPVAFSHPIPFQPISSCPIPSHIVLSCPVLPHPISSPLLHPIAPHPVPSHPASRLPPGAPAQPRSPHGGRPHLKKPLQPSQVMTWKWYPVARSPHTAQTFSSPGSVSSPPGTGGPGSGWGLLSPSEGLDTDMVGGCG